MRRVHHDDERVIECTLCSGSARSTSLEMPVLAWVQMPSAVVDMRAAFEFVTMLSQQRRGPAAHANDLRGA